MAPTPACHRAVDRRRIAITSDHLGAGGAERSVANAAALLADMGYDVYLLTATDLPDHFTVDPRVHRLRLGGYAEVFDLLREKAIPIALHYGYWNPQLAELIGHDSGRADVMCFRSSYFRSLSDYSPRNFLLLRDHWNRAAAVTTLTRSTQYVFSRFLDAVFLIPNFYSKPVGEPAPLKANRILAHSSSGRVRIKRPDKALRVFRKVVDAYPIAQLTFVGQYDLETRLPDSNLTLGELQAQLGLEQGQVEWAGEQSAIEPFYEGSSVVVLTSRAEGFPNVLLEAAAHGVPRVCFRFPGIEDMLHDGIDGFTVEQDDIDGMAERVIRLLSDPELRRGMGSAAQETARSFSRDKVQASWSTLLDALHTEDPARIAAAARQQYAEFTPDFPRLLAEYDRYLVDAVRRLVECQDARRSLADRVASANQERDALREQLRALREEHSASVARTRDHADRITVLTRSLREHEATLAQRESRIKDLELGLRDTNTEFAEREARLATLEKEIVDPEALIRQLRTRLEAADSKVTATEQERDGYALRLERLRAQSDTQAQELARTIALSQQQQGELVRLRRECDRIETHAAVLKDKLDAAWEAQRAIKQRYKEATSDHWYQFGRLNWKGKLRSLLASGSRKLKK